jgi:hypothetical protein
MVRPLFIVLAAATLTAGAAVAQDQDTSMSFFVTSENPGDGANLGGLEGADAHCAMLAENAGVTGKEWRAYLSSSEEDARDRIGSGPWHNSEGVQIAADVDDLHSDANKISKETALDENGEQIAGRGDSPNRHDVLTGSNPDGTRAEQTCEDWTSGGEGSAMVGHHDRMGLDETPPAKSWNASHPSRGCSLEDLRGTGGDGLFYCFAAN